MEIKINKEIKEYGENIFFGLNLRQVIFSILAILISVFIFIRYRLELGNEITSWICIGLTLPLAAMGFIKYHGLTFEKLLLQVIKSYILSFKRLIYNGG